MEEYIDICDKEGNLTGEKKLRSQVHLDGDWHRAAHIWILNNKGDILMQRRAKTKGNSPDMFDISAGGHVTSGQTMVEGALSELEEELGIKVSEKDLIHIGTAIQQSIAKEGAYINNEYNDIFVLYRDVEPEDLTLQKEEVAYVKWITVDELKRWVEEEREDLVIHSQEFNLLFRYIDS